MEPLSNNLYMLSADWAARPVFVDEVYGFILMGYLLAQPPPHAGKYTVSQCTVGMRVVATAWTGDGLGDKIGARFLRDRRGSGRIEPPPGGY
jgi:hypothetical protein